MPEFVIQKHTKRRTHHYDIMLRQGTKLLTWSIKDIRTLQDIQGLTSARKLPDHRLIYLTYQGKIFRGRGEVKIWDKGSYLRSGPSLIRLTGRKIKALYYLVPDIRPGQYWFIKIGDYSS